MSKKLKNIIIHRGISLYAVAVSGDWNKSKKELHLEGALIIPDQADPVDFLPDGQLPKARFSVIAGLEGTTDAMNITINNLALISVSGNWKSGSGVFEFKGRAASRSARALESARGVAAQGTSLHIGVNEVDPDHYGSDMRLNGCVNDSIDMRQLAARAGFSTRALTNDQATRGNVINAIKDAAGNLKNGDMFLLTYAGHGSQIVDTTNLEADGKNETWCLHDGMLIDDELYELWTQFDPGVRIFIISDSCNSGTIARNVDASILRSRLRKEGFVPRVLELNRSMIVFHDHLEFYETILNGLAERGVSQKTVNAHVRLLSGSQDNQLSYEIGGSGAFTTRLKEVWNTGRFSGNYTSFAKQIVEGMPSHQTPNHYLVGVNSKIYNNEKPFTIQQEGTSDVATRGLAHLAARGHHNGGVFNRKKVAQKV